MAWALWEAMVWELWGWGVAWVWELVQGMEDKMAVDMARAVVATDEAQGAEEVERKGDTGRIKLCARVVSAAAVDEHLHCYLVLQWPQVCQPMLDSCSR